MALSDALQRFNAALKAKLQLPLNCKDELLIRQNGAWASRPTVIPFGVAHSPADVDLMKGVSESFAQVFNRWQRISRLHAADPLNVTGDDYSDAAVPSELDSWTYDEINNRVVCSINSVSLLGFISPQRYDNYTLEAVLRSNNGDNDFIGFCIAHAYNPDTGNTEILTAIRQLNGMAPLMIEKNRRSFTASEYIVQSIFSGLKWADGTVAVAGQQGAGNLPGWNVAPNGTRLKVERAGDIITVSTSQINETTYFAPATTTFDLSQHPELEVFRGPQRYGYVCLSQPQSTWEVLQRPGENTPIWDMPNEVLWTWNGTGWVSSPMTYSSLLAQGYLTPQWLVVSPADGRFYMATPTELKVLS